MNDSDRRQIRAMTKTPNLEFARRLRATEIVTVRCSFCTWSWTGPAETGGRWGGALARGQSHARTHTMQRAKRARWRERKRQEVVTV